MTHSTSPWAPLEQRTFRFIWIATVFSNIGTWMHDVGAAWLMVTLTSDPLMISLIQAATALPIFILALPAGALADIVDRRRYLLIVQCLMFVTALALAITSWQGATTPWVLIAFTFALGCGAAFSAPAWQAVTPELVPKEQLGAAVALNSMGINVSRAIGPALGGLLIVMHGPVLTFALNALTFIGIIVILYRWQRESTTTALPTERFFHAMRAGMRYAYSSPALHIVLIRAVAFFMFASAVWALLPLIAKQELNQEAGGYGLLMGAIGLGAILGATQLPKLRERYSSDQRVMVASVLMACVAFALSVVDSLAIALIVMLLMGLAWIVALSSLNMAAQQSAPSWVRARVLSIYLIAFFGSMAFGSALWGACAKLFSIPEALMMAGAAQLIAVVLTYRLKLGKGEGRDLAPSGHWPAPLVSSQPELDKGPVLITIEYHVVPEYREAFEVSSQGLKQMRRRDGAFFWSLFEDVADSNKMIETFMVTSWVEHLRQHERVTEEDKALQLRLREYLVDGNAPVVSHYVKV